MDHVEDARDTGQVNYIPIRQFKNCPVSDYWAQYGPYIFAGLPWKKLYKLHRPLSLLTVMQNMILSYLACFAIVFCNKLPLFCRVILGWFRLEAFTPAYVD